MSDLMDTITKSLSGNLPQLSQHLGVSESQTQSALSTALPTLISAMSRNAESDGGNGLLGMLDRDNDGSILDDIGSLIGNRQTEQRGDQFLGSILGGKRGSVENAVSQSSGLSSGQTSSLMKLLGPMLMGALSKKSSGGFDAGSLLNMVQGERKTVEKNSGGGSFIGRLLDQDGDGDFDLSDAAKMGMSYFGKMFKS